MNCEHFVATDVLVDAVLHILTLLIQEHEKHSTRQQTQLTEAMNIEGEEKRHRAESIKDLCFPELSLIARIKHTFSTLEGKKSILSLLLDLKKRTDLVEEQTTVDTILAAFQKADTECEQMLNATLADTSTEGRKKTARELARERILAQMKKQQLSFLQKSEQQDEKAEETIEEYEQQEEKSKGLYVNHTSHECVLCKEAKSWEEKPLGLIATCKRSRIVSLVFTPSLLDE